MNNKLQDFLMDVTQEALIAAMSVPRAIATNMQKTTQSMAPNTDAIHTWAEQTTETIGKVVTPFAENPLIKMGTKVPGISWLMAALGQVDVEKVNQEVAELRRQHPTDSTDQLVRRVIADSSMRAAQIGLVTNFIPPAALLLSALDLGAVAALQANMVYRIATLYGFSPTDSARRGEVIAIWGLFSGGSGLLKSGLSFVELIPGLGAAVGVTSDAALLYGMGQIAMQFYEQKRAKQNQQDTISV
ncbi:MULTISPECIES: hypothetical protein [unclassified Leptolyngbya]|uniref:hypothetical protein n=1 Tax=unclassified Leptolyngbya TaxID=2650499 RepID=UPI001682AB01|nr:MULTISPECIES: hypothetical protein [unclassified Leptolyngbya]MBD1910790.1 hypothetical protein [Leptolyngbya sp. FACHB-8]MBD2158866.1 hypothetical protein [Leptolyngbya sp. FACHB-16]